MTAGSWKTLMQKNATRLVSVFCSKLCVMTYLNFLIIQFRTGGLGRWDWATCPVSPLNRCPTLHTPNTHCDFKTHHNHKHFEKIARVVFYNHNDNEISNYLLVQLIAFLDVRCIILLLFSKKLRVAHCSGCTMSGSSSSGSSSN